MLTNLLLYSFILFNNVFTEVADIDGLIGKKNLTSIYTSLSNHRMVTDTEGFPYVCAILKRDSYISAGALIDDTWILTAADALFLLRETAREIRVRLGSINFRKGGLLTPIQLIKIHPYFSDTKPEFDIALIKLANPVRLLPNLNPIRVQKKPREITAMHFIVTAWPVLTEKNPEELQKITSLDTIKRRRILTVSQLHPTEPQKCQEEMDSLDINVTGVLMCLDTAPASNPCARDVGAPVVVNGILWGIISSFKTEDCAVDYGPSFVNLVSAPDISSWIHANVRGHRWGTSFTDQTTVDDTLTPSSDEYYDESFENGIELKS